MRNQVLITFEGTQQGRNELIAFVAALKMPVYQSALNLGSVVSIQDSVPDVNPDRQALRPDGWWGSYYECRRCGVNAGEPCINLNGWSPEQPQRDVKHPHLGRKRGN